MIVPFLTVPPLGGACTLNSFLHCHCLLYNPSCTTIQWLRGNTTVPSVQGRLHCGRTGFSSDLLSCEIHRVCGLPVCVSARLPSVAQVNLGNTIEFKIALYKENMLEKEHWLGFKKKENQEYKSIPCWIVGFKLFHSTIPRCRHILVYCHYFFHSLIMWYMSINYLKKHTWCWKFLPTLGALMWLGIGLLG